MFGRTMQLESTWHIYNGAEQKAYGNHKLHIINVNKSLNKYIDTVVETKQCGCHTNVALGRLKLCYIPSTGRVVQLFFPMETMAFIS